MVVRQHRDETLHDDAAGQQQRQEGRKSLV
jgi:hypothetical protein